MKTLLSTTCAVLCTMVMHAQLTTINTGTKLFNNGATINISAGSFTNNGIYIDTTSPGAFNVSGGVTFSGAGSTTIYDFNINSGSSQLDTLISVYNTATVGSGDTLDAKNNLYIRSDLKANASLVVNGVLTNNVRGLITKASAATGGCLSYTSNLSVNVSGSAILYQWESSPDSLSWTSITGATAATYTATVTATQYFHCAITTNNSSFAENTAGIKLVFSGGSSPTPISGSPALCMGNTTTLSDSSPGGVWSSNNTSVAVVGSGSGIVSGLAAGTSTITYDLGTGCNATTTITVNPLPSSITGVTNVCAGSTTTLSTAGSGTWSSSSAGIATVGSTNGMVTGVSAGTATITYTVSTGCITTTDITVKAAATTITGNASLCNGATTTLSNGVAGSWSSANTTIATVDSAGVVTGRATGKSTITYSPTNGCAAATRQVTVNALPAAITGKDSVCEGATVTLSDATTSGHWNSSNTAVATIGSSSTIVTGISAGTADISYTLGTGCAATKTVTVNEQPSAITGAASVCIGSSITLSDDAGGSWNSGSTLIASVDAVTGVVTGIAAGASSITYTFGKGCVAKKTITVNSLPVAITGKDSVCEGATVTLSDATASGRWSSSNTAVATIGSSSRVVTGISAGTADISYTLSTGCAATKTVTVNEQPSAITGMASVCIGSTITLSDDAGGSWNSGSTSVASVDAGTGIVTGIAAGASSITYTFGKGCVAKKTITVNSLPVAITGKDSVCEGATIALSDATASGHWSSSNTAVATIGSSSTIVNGISAGTAAISYVLSTGCAATKTITVSSCGSAKPAFDSSVMPLGTNNTTLSAQSFQVYPNPNNGTFTLLLSSAIDERAMVIISNIVGQKAMEIPIVANKPLLITLGSNQPAGIYFITASTPRQKYEVKVVVSAD